MDNDFGKPYDKLQKKYEDLVDYLKSLKSVAVAFSGGVDSSFLLYASIQALGSGTAAITAISKIFPEREEKEASELCRRFGVRQITVPHDEMKLEAFTSNPPDRCYICKKDLFSQFLKTAESEGFLRVAEGSNLDDEGDYRPGMRAVSELGILSPLRRIGFTKKEIRCLCRHFDIPVWDKPSYACLASRFPYGEEITSEKLRMVEMGEQLLIDQGFRQMRVRIHGNVARIELDPKDFERFMTPETRKKVCNEFKKIGFSYTALDISGYRTGSMNETLGR